MAAKSLTTWERNCSSFPTWYHVCVGTSTHKNVREGNVRCCSDILPPLFFTPVFICNSIVCDWTGIRTCPHLCATQVAAFTCRLQPNPFMELQHSTHFSKQTNTRRCWNATEDTADWPFPNQDKTRIRHFLPKTSEAAKQNHYSCSFSNLLEGNKCITKTIFPANALSHLFPLSVSIPPPPSFFPSPYSTIEHSSRWLGFNNSRSWWGQSWRANTGTGSSICLWMGNNDPHPPDTSSWQKRGGWGGTKSPKGIKGKWTFGSEGFRSMGF